MSLKNNTAKNSVKRKIEDGSEESSYNINEGKAAPKKHRKVHLKSRDADEKEIILVQSDPVEKNIKAIHDRVNENPEKRLTQSQITRILKPITLSGAQDYYERMGLNSTIDELAHRSAV